MKEKSAMEDKFFDFAKTKDALGELSASLVELESAVKSKCLSLENEKKKLRTVLEVKEQKITEMEKSVQAALDKIEAVNKQIGEIL